MTDKDKSSSLAERSISGAGWVFTNRITCRIISMLKLIVLARLLTPEDFGLFGIVTLTIVMFKEFTLTGIDTFLIQRKNNTEEFLNIGWTIECLRGLIMASILFVFTPLISRFFNEPRIIPLLYVIGISFIIEGATNIGIIYFEKELQFHKQFYLDLISNLISFAVGLILAYLLRSVWALVFAEFTWGVTRCILSYFLHPYRPRLHFDLQRSKKALHFGKWVLGYSITVYLANQIDNIMVGKFLGAGALGLYAMAYNLSVLPMKEITNTISRVAFPGYAKIQNDPDKIKSGFDRLFQLSNFLSIPACTGIVLIAPLLIDFVLGEKWSGIVFPMQILMIAQIIKSILSTGTPLFLGVGKPNYEFYMQAVRTIGLMIFIYPLMRWQQLPGASWAVVISAVFMSVPFFIYVNKILSFRMRDLIKRLIPTVIGTLIMALPVAFLTSLVSRQDVSKTLAFFSLAGIVISGAVVYFVSACFLGKRLGDISISNDISHIYSICLGKIISLKNRLGKQ